MAPTTRRAPGNNWGNTEGIGATTPCGDPHSIRTKRPRQSPRSITPAAGDYNSSCPASSCADPAAAHCTFAALIAAVSASSESRQMRLRLPFTVFAQHRIAAGEQLKALAHLGDDRLRRQRADAVGRLRVASIHSSAVVTPGRKAATR